MFSSRHNMTSDGDSEDSEPDSADIAKYAQDADDLDKDLFGSAATIQKPQLKLGRKKPSHVSFEDIGNLDDLLSDTEEPVKNVQKRDSFNRGDSITNVSSNQQLTGKQQLIADLFIQNDQDKRTNNIESPRQDVKSSNDQASDWLGLKSSEKSHDVAETVSPLKRVEGSTSIKFDGDDDILSSMGLGVGPRTEPNNPKPLSKHTIVDNSNIVPEASKAKLNDSPIKTDDSQSILFGNYAPTISREPRRLGRRNQSSGPIDLLGLLSTPKPQPDSQKPFEIPSRLQQSSSSSFPPEQIVGFQNASLLSGISSGLNHQESPLVNQLKIPLAKVPDAKVAADSTLPSNRGTLPSWISGPSVEGVIVTTVPRSSASNVPVSDAGRRGATSPLSTLTKQELFDLLSSVHCTQQPTLNSEPHYEALAQQVQQLVAQQQYLSQLFLTAQQKTADDGGSGHLEAEINQLRSALDACQEPLKHMMEQIRQQVEAKQVFDEDQRKKLEAEVESRWESRVNKMAEETRSSEDLHELKIAWLEKEYTFREQQHLFKIARMQEESTAVQEQNQRKVAALEQETKDTEERHRKRLTEVQAEHAADLKQLREFHRKSVEDWREHQTALYGGQSVDTMQAMLSHLTQHAGDMRGADVKAKEIQLQASQDMLSKQREWSEAERERLLALVTSLELQLNEQRQRIEEERWSVRRESARVAAQLEAFDRDREREAQRVERERADIQAAREAMKTEAMEMAERLEQQRLAIAADKARLATLARLHSDAGQSSDVARMKAELTAALQVAQAAERDAATERSRLTAEQRRLAAEQQRLAETERDLEAKAHDLGKMSQMAVQTMEQGKQALAEVAAREDELMQRAVDVQRQLDLVAERERRCVQQKVSLSEERIMLRTKALPELAPSYHSRNVSNNDHLYLLNVRPEKLDYSAEHRRNEYLSEHLSYYSVSK